MTGPALITQGPCEPWTDAAAAAECCPDLATSDLDVLDQAAQEASEILYQLSGQRFPGLCERTVRPCSRTCTCFQVLSRGHIVGWDGGAWSWGPGGRCGCRPLSTIVLTGSPVREILSVEIDGEVLDAADYRLDRGRNLVRLGDGRWPACQNMGADSGAGTFFVTYLYGRDAPLAGVSAATQLACELAKACGGGSGGGSGGDCELPAGTVRITRQGLTVDTQTLGLWLLGTQRTGMPQVDAFLSVFGVKNPRRPAAVYAPELDPFPLPVQP